MTRLSIQFRLALWFCLSLSVIVALFAASSWFALRASMYHSVDRDLQYRISTVVPFIQNRSLNTRDQFARTLAGSSDASVVGLFIQITNDQQQILYESDLLSWHRAPVMPAGRPDGSVSMNTVGEAGWPLRIANQRIQVNSVPLTVHVVEPLRDVLDSLREYSIDMLTLLPLALALIGAVGYWMSRRALAPVEAIRRQAEAIDPADLTARLQVPPTDDELSRLAQTLNAMLTRIEAGFRSIERFTADASHELRAPLALITTAGEVSLRKQRTAEELSDVLRKVLREARHMSRLVENLLGLARGDANQQQAELSPIDIAAALSELCAELKPAAQSKGIELTGTVPDHEIWVLGDATEVRRLFVILLDNAIKYTEAGSIRVTVTALDNDVVINVSDTGIGIEPTSLPHVFDRFWRADKVRSRSEGGAGLGLSIAAQIVQRHAGTISVDSRIGQGSTFTVILKPASPPHSAVSALAGTRNRIE